MRGSIGNCQLLSSVICGDVDWVIEVEQCDDGNRVDGDGCNSQCKVEQDYRCDVVDMLASGAAFCKFTKDFYLSFAYL